MMFEKKFDLREISNRRHRIKKKRFKKVQRLNESISSFSFLTFAFKYKKSKSSRLKSNVFTFQKTILFIIKKFMIVYEKYLTSFSR